MDEFILNCYYNNFIISRLSLLMQRGIEFNRSNLFQNPNLLDTVVSNLDTYDDKSIFESTLGSIDQQIYDEYAAFNYRTNSISRELYNEPTRNSIKLAIPKFNSLTDNLIRTTFGCEEKLAKSYVQILDNPAKRDENSRKTRAESAKKKYAEANSHKDLVANSKPFMNNIRFALQRPVVDNEHESYLKTQLIFLEQPRGPSINTKQYFDKHTDLIAKKINELGGMEDTIGQMEESLSKNQVRGFKKKQILSSMSAQRKSMFSPQKHPALSESRHKDNWVNRSREMRQSFIARLQIE